LEIYLHLRLVIGALKNHWPEYLIEATCLGLFMISAFGFATILEHPASPLQKSSLHFLRQTSGLSTSIGLMIKHSMKFSCALAALAMIAGCGSLEVGQDVQAGRNALQTGQPESAVAYLARASAQDPAYKTPYRLSQNVLSYLGRAYYETGWDKEARAVLEQGLTRDSGDSLAHLYLGLVLLRSGERERGGREIQIGLKTLHEDIDDLAADNIWGSYWDPARQIRGDIQKAAALGADSPELPALVQHIGKSTDEEPDRVRREEARTLYGRGGDS